MIDLETWRGQFDIDTTCVINPARLRTILLKSFKIMMISVGKRMFFIHSKVCIGKMELQLLKVNIFLFTKTDEINANSILIMSADFAAFLNEVIFTSHFPNKKSFRGKCFRGKNQMNAGG